MTKKTNKTAARIALTAAVAALPGLSTVVSAALPPEENKLEYRFTLYSEDDSPAARVFYPGPSPVLDRYSIMVHQTALQKPLGSNKLLSLSGQYETLSGASPLITTQVDGSEDQAKLYMSGASIHETRYDASASLRIYGEKSSYAFSLAGSKENDYKSLSGGLDGELEIFDKLTTLNGGLSYSYDVLNPTLKDPNNPTDVTTPGRVAAQDQIKTQFSVFEGFSQIISPETIVRAGLSVSFKSGYMSDPYRESPVATSSSEYVLYDIRPDQRLQISGVLGYRHYLSNLDTALHADYRLYIDNWGVLSNTVETSLRKRFAADSDKERGLFAWLTSHDFAWTMAPKARYYQQTAAYFYELAEDPSSNPDYYVDSTHYYSSDARLSKYGALEIGLENRIDFDGVSVDLNYGRYFSRPAFGFSSEEVPGLPSFWFASGGFSYSW